MLRLKNTVEAVVKIHTFCRSGKDRQRKVMARSECSALVFFVLCVIMRSIFPFLLLCAACTTRFGTADEQAIRAVMAEQEAAWDKGDILGFMQGYSDTVCFIGSRGSTCGRDAVTANYQRSYPDPSAMGDLAFGDLELLPAGADHAWVTGTWTLLRQADTLAGGFSLLWVKELEGWRIARDHTH